MSKAKLVSEVEVDYALKSCNIIRRQEASIAEALAGEIPRWSPYVPMLVKAPTGFGKSHFVIHDLIPFVRDNGGKLLLASNRLAASSQQKGEIAKVLKHPLEGCSDAACLQRFEDFGVVRVMTLQHLLTFLSTEEGQQWCKDVSHVVIDECHYFTSDSAFNQWTGVLLHKIPQVFSQAVRLYMSATPEDVLLPLVQAEKRIPLPPEQRFKRYYCYPPYGLGASVEKEFVVHMFDASYDHIHLRYFRNENTLINKIQATPVREKWMIFVTSIKSGQALKKQLAEKIGSKDVCLITAKDKGSPEWIKLVNQEQLSYRITLATSVLDCGANVNDRSLKHMVIHSVQHTEYMQELGRKRCKNGEEFTLYVPVPDSKYLSTIRRQIDRQLELVQMIQDGDDEAREKIFRELWQKNDPSLKAMVWLTEYHQLRINDVAAHAVGCQKKQLNDLEDMISLHGDEAFPRLVHRWLKQEDGYDADFWLEDDREAEYRVALLEFLEEHCNNPFDSESEKRALRRLVECLLKFSKMKKDRKERKDDLKHVALNNRLEALEIPFWVENRKDVWTIHKCESSEANGGSNTQKGE